MQSRPIPSSDETPDQPIDQEIPEGLLLPDEWFDDFISRPAYRELLERLARNDEPVKKQPDSPAIDAVSFFDEMFERKDFLEIMRRLAD